MLEEQHPYKKIQSILRYLADHKIDLACLCETHMTNELLNELTNRFPQYGWFTNSPHRNKLGVAFVILNPKRVPKDSCSVSWEDTVGRSLGLTCEVEGSKGIKILGIYAPNAETDKKDFFEDLVDTEALRDTHFILGDFNATEYPIDRNPRRNEDPRIRDALRGAFNDDRLGEACFPPDRSRSKSTPFVLCTIEIL